MVLDCLEHKIYFKIRKNGIYYEGFYIKTIKI